MTWICRMAVFAILVPNSICDFRKKEVLLPFTLLAAAGGFFYRLLAEQVPVWQIAAAAAPGAFLLLLALLTGGKIGMGDGWVVMALGLWSGTGRITAALAAALLLAAAVSAILLLRRSRVREIPFIPFLLLAYLLLLPAQCA